MAERLIYGTLSFRLLFAALLLFGGEALVWPHTGGRDALDGGLGLIGYGLLATLWLDLTVRYRVRDLFGLMTQAGFYALLAALLIHPQYSYADLPTSLMTRVMGAQALIALEMGGLLLALTGGGRTATRLLFGGAVVVGLAWGSWLRWWPADEGLPPVELSLLLTVGIGGMLGILALTVLNARLMQATTVEALRLSPAGLGAVVIGLLALLVLRLLQGLIDPGVLLVSGLLLLLCWAILWFRGREKGATLLTSPPAPSPSVPQTTLKRGIRPLIAAVLFLVVSLVAFQSPRIGFGEVDQLRFIGVGFTAYGLAWLPTVSLMLGGRAFMRQISERRM
jgi:hypothetical protein